MPFSEAEINYKHEFFNFFLTFLWPEKLPRYFAIVGEIYQRCMSNLISVL
jgi:hypothetical protein